MAEENQITDEMVADPNAEPPVFEDDEVTWTDEVGDEAEPESEGEAEDQE